MNEQKRKRIMERLAKMKALADGGVGGERVNAAALLESVAAKYGISIDELADAEQETMHPVQVQQNGWKHDLLSQLLALMRHEQYGSTKVDHCQLYYSTRGGKVVGHSIKCTDAQFVELMAKYTILERDYAKQLRSFFRAFLDANDLLVPAEDERPSTKEEIEADKAASWLARGIRKSNLRKQIGEGEA